MTRAGAGHPGTCPVCGARLKRNGVTSAGTTRWRCTGCGGSSTKRRPDRTRAAQLDAFVAWLLGNATQCDVGSSARTFRRQHAWCWNVDPHVEVTGEIYDEIQLDGTYLSGGWCLLLAIDGGTGDVIAYQWCDEEKTVAWTALLERIPPPRVAVIDGGRGLASALRACWPHTLIQRCLVHVQRNVRTYVTTRPRTEAGKGLRKLSLTLTRIKTRDEAAQWMAALNDWHQRHRDYINQRTTATDPGAIRPTWVKPAAQSWWTHDRARKAYNLLALLTKRGHLFTYLRQDLDGLAISSTTNRIEGAGNAGIKDLLRRHRGMTSDHQRRAVEWFCHQHSPAPTPPSALIRPEHYKPRPTAIVPTDNEPVPGDYGTTATAEEGLWARKGWAGRSS